MAYLPLAWPSPPPNLPDVGTIGTILSQANPNANYIGTIGTLLSGILVTGTIGTLQSTANIAVASLVPLVGSVQSTANMAVASLVPLVGSLQSLSNIAVASAVGSLLSQSNVAVASLVGSIGSPVIIGGGTIQSNQQGATCTPTTVTVNTSSTSLLAASATRKEFTVTLLQTGTLMVCYTATALATIGIMLNNVGQTLSDGIYTGAVSAICIAGTVGVSVQQVTT